MKNKLTKAAMFTDIHFGRRSNSEVHNQDCLNFVSWFCDHVRSDPTIDHVLFLGDWYQHRDAINISTLSYAYKAAKMLNELGIPIYVCVGNHDLHKRNSRDVFSTEVFQELSNFIVVSEPTVFKELGPEGALLSPYIFHEEYADLHNFLDIPIWAGHFEFKGFILTGQHTKMLSGPEAERFSRPTKIFTGHFHKRQYKNNIRYIGNAFPMDFSDANDVDRGMLVYDYVSDVENYINWADCPKYISTTLSLLIDDPATFLLPESRVKCVVDVPMSFEEGHILRQKLAEDYTLRELTFVESDDLDQLLSTEVESDEDGDENEDNQVKSVDEMVIKMLEGIEHELIDNSVLISIYKDIPIQ